MDYTGQKRLELFVDNSQMIKKEFIWHSSLTKRFAALLYAQAGKRIDCDGIQQCIDLIKENTGVFSTFRGNMVLSMAAMLSLSPNPQKRFGETQKVYDLLKGIKFQAHDYLVVAAYQIAQSDNYDYTPVITRAKGFYDGMKARHFFYTGQDDYIFSTMLGLSDLDPSEGVERIERLYGRLKGEFLDKNSVQALAQVLVLGGVDDRASDDASVGAVSGDSTSVDDAANRVLSLRDGFRAQKIRLDKTYTLPMLGILALLPVEIDTIVRDISTVFDTLRNQKGFGSLSISSQELLLFAASIVAGEYTEHVKDGVLNATLSTSLTNIILAQEAAMIAAFSASAITAASTSS